MFVHPPWSLNMVLWHITSRSSALRACLPRYCKSHLSRFNNITIVLVQIWKYLFNILSFKEEYTLSICVRHISTKQRIMASCLLFNIMFLSSSTLLFLTSALEEQTDSISFIVHITHAGMLYFKISNLSIRHLQMSVSLNGIWCFLTSSTRN